MPTPPAGNKRLNITDILFDFNQYLLNVELLSDQRLKLWSS